MTDTQKLYDRIEEHLTELYRNRTKNDIVFHTIDRCFDLATLAEKIADKTGLDDDEKVQAVVAAYYIYSGYWSEENQPVFNASENLKSFSKEEISVDFEAITRLLESINDHDEGKSQQEKVLYDTFHAHLGQKKLLSNIELVLLESGQDDTSLNFMRETLDLILKHKYRTSYALTEFARRKAKNGQKLLAAIKKLEKKNKKEKRKSRKLGRGIETMYRTVYRNHINLSSIADAKANLIIRVNTIILSIIITLGGTGYTFIEGGFFKYSRFTIPIMVFVAGSLLAVIFAILSARPKVTNKEVSKKRLLGNESSILFFGNFTALDKKDFLREMGIFRQNNDRVYDSMSIDIYYLGLVLDKKYKLVKYSYNIFMIGLSLSVVSFMTLFMITQFA